MGNLYISKVKIKEFRRFYNTELYLNKFITLIAGQNATSKSTLLGMLCQPFTFTDKKRYSKNGNQSAYLKNYHGVNLDNYNNILGKKFAYDANEVFRLSSLHDTKDKKYEYSIFFDGDVALNPKLNNGLLVRGEDRPDVDKVRFVAGLGKSSNKGEGNFPHPVIYLGMERHWPLANYKEVKLENSLLSDLNEKDKVWFSQNYNDILLLSESSNVAESVELDGKKRLGINSKDYNSESFSAGQSNLGQILTSILAFRKLKEKLDTTYCGGLLLIDEIDSTLHASSQFKLLDFLVKESEELKLQIVGTTHSLFLLEKALYGKYKKTIKVVYLERVDNTIEISQPEDFETINLKLKSEASLERDTHKKVSVICEDIVAHNFLSALLGPNLRKYVNNIYSKNIDSISHTYVDNLLPLIGKVKELDKVIFIPDGDAKRNDFEKKYKNLIYLPGDMAMECLILKFLISINDKNPLWKNLKGKNLNKQSLILMSKAKYPLLMSDISKTNDRYKEYKKECKSWFKEKQVFWGRGMAIVFKAWIKENETICNEFRKKFKKILERCLEEKISD